MKGALDIQYRIFKRIQSSCENSSGWDWLGRGLKMVKVGSEMERNLLRSQNSYEVWRQTKPQSSWRGTIGVSLLEVFTNVRDGSEKLTTGMAQHLQLRTARCCWFHHCRSHFLLVGFLLMSILRVSGSTKAIIHSRLELFSPLSPNEI